MTAATVGWSPALHPFSSKYSSRIRGFANELAQQAGDAMVDPVKTKLEASALAFDDLSVAMSNHNRAGVDTAVNHTQVAYAALRAVCP
jgi:hypothetical protein